VKNLNKILQSLFLREFFALLESCEEVSFIAVLKDEVDVVEGLFDVDQANDIVVAAASKYLDLVLKKFCKLS
jgi:hypothetical protein